jgi:hypothetical protein
MCRLSRDVWIRGCGHRLDFLWAIEVGKLPALPKGKHGAVYASLDGTVRAISTNATQAGTVVFCFPLLACGAADGASRERSSSLHQGGA